MALSNSDTANAYKATWKWCLLQSGIRADGGVPFSQAWKATRAKQCSESDEVQERWEPPNVISVLCRKVTRDLAVKLLLDNGADVDQKDNRGQTALHMAASASNNTSDIIKILLDSGADINTKDLIGDTAANIAFRRQNGKVYYALLKRGASAAKEGGTEAKGYDIEEGQADQLDPDLPFEYFINDK
ncbi:MAG: hypothetical protein M1814_005161 [Vezdaea aestivalis]|nr:MAG: hypothetical protein M1814_005161 [Vezdaea aestivalis]